MNLVRLLSLVARIGADARDSSDIRLRKTILVTSSLILIFAGAIWGMLYSTFNEPIAGAIPLSYSFLSTISLLAFARVRNFPIFRFIQLLLILSLPFLLQITLGGFISSSAVVLWSLICPIGALVLADLRQAFRWFAIYLGLVATSGFLQTYTRASNNLPPEFVTLFFVLNISAISATAFCLIALFIAQKDSAYNLLRAEQEKSENLLLNILPKEIAHLLKNQGGTIADYYDQVSILFADIVDFTPLSAELSAREVVETLNEIFTQFDSLVDEYGVEKIETVGDEYMAACGVPRACPDHAHALARLALRMCAFVATRPARANRQLAIRIGIHSGPVVGGVIGRKKFAFELFGDTVNTANRMQSHGASGKIQISRATYELIKNDFICESRGPVTIKGKGTMETWFVVAEK